MILERATLEKPIALAATRTPPSEIRVFKRGKVETTKGTFLFDDKAGASVMKAWKSYGNDLMFDFEHYSVSGDSPGDGKAAGWFQLELRDDGLYAVNIKWTDQAASQIAKAEWRYFSPTFDFDKKSGRILELVNVALTNIPATKNLPALVAAQKERSPMSPAKKTTMKPKTKAEIANAKLGLKKTKKTITETEEDTAKAEEAEDAGGDSDDADDADDAETDEESDDEESSSDADDGDSDDTDGDDDDDDDGDKDDSSGDLAEKAKKMKKTSRSPSSHDRAILAAVHELTGGKTGSEAIGVLRGLRANSDTVATLSQQVDALRRTSRRERVKVAVDAAVKAGKLMPAQREAFTKIGMRDLKELKGLLDTMPKRVRMSGEEVVESGVTGATEMTEREREIVRRAGSLELYTEAKKANTLVSLDRFVTGNEN